MTATMLLTDRMEIRGTVQWGGKDSVACVSLGRTNTAPGRKVIVQKHIVLVTATLYTENWWEWNSGEQVHHCSTFFSETCIKAQACDE